MLTTVLPSQVLVQEYWNLVQMVQLPPTSLFYGMDGLEGPGVVLGLASCLVIDPGNET